MTQFRADRGAGLLERCMTAGGIERITVHDRSTTLFFLRKAPYHVLYPGQ